MGQFAEFFKSIYHAAGILLSFELFGRTPSTTPKPKSVWRRLRGTAPVIFLQVFDIPEVASTGSKILLTISNQGSNGSDGTEELKLLPAQETGCLRVYLCETGDTGKNLEEFVLQNLHGLNRDTCSVLERLNSPSFSRLRSQWRLADHSLSWLSRTYGFTAWRSPEPFTTSAHSSLWFSAGLTRFSKSICVAKDDQGRMLVFISNHSEVINLYRFFPNHLIEVYEKCQPDQADATIHLVQFCTALRVTLNLCSLANHPDSDRTLAQLVLLTVCQCSLDRLSDFIDNFQDFYTTYRESVVDPRYALLNEASLHEIVRDAYFYQDLRECVTHLTSTTKSLVELLSAVQPQTNPGFETIAAESRAICTDLINSSNQLATRLESNLRLIQLLRSFKETRSVWVLSLLACVFLPLSLAASLLSMQTRFANLHFLLYDFFGVIVLSGTIVIIIIFLLNLYVNVNKQILRWEDDPTFERWIGSSFRRFCRCACIFLWLCLLGSFSIGMTQSVKLGLIILKFGAIIFGCLTLCYGLGSLFMWKLVKGAMT